MAEGALRSALRRNGLDPADFRIDSAGTHDFHAGKPPFELAVAAAKRRGHDISHQRARRITPGDFDNFDFILVMDRGHLSHLRTICPTRCKQKVELLLEYGDRYHGREVPDPYGGTSKDFERALDLIEDGCAGFATLIAQMNRPRVAPSTI